jgi:mannose-6-phosphate isomerase-like protein (cupin superfamily)
VELTIVSQDAELLAMEAAYDGSGQMPPAHYHPSQAERFTVLEGRMRAIIGGSEHVYEEGAIFDVPEGAVHQMAAEGGRARVRWEVRPPLRTAEFFERLYGGQVDENFLEEFSPEIRFVDA